MASSNRLSKNRLTGKSSTKLKPYEETMTNSIDNYKTRLKAIGKEDIDTRNFIEKKLNLPENQNVLFDIFDIIGRPQQAIFGAIDEAVTGGNFFEGLEEGWTGKTKTTGGQLLRDMGMRGTGDFNLLNKDTWDEASLSDVLGFGLDLFADPVDIGLWATVPLTGGATAPVAVANTTGDVVKTADKVVDAVKVADTAVDTAQKTKLAFRPFQKGSKSTLDLALGGAGKAIKKGAKVGDNLLTKGLTKLDEIENAKITRLADEGYNISKVKPSNFTENYNYAKKSTQGFVDASKQLPNNLVNSFRKASDKSELARRLSNEQLKLSKDDITNYAKTASKTDNALKGLTDEQTFNKVAEDVGLMMEQNVDRTVKGGNFFKRISSKNRTFEGTVESVYAIKNILDEYSSKIVRRIGKENKIYTISNDGTKITINTKNIDMVSFKNSKEIREAFGALTLDRGKVLYTTEQLKRIDELKNNKEFMDLVDTLKQRQKNITDIYKKYTGVDYSEITDRPGYFTASRETEVGKSKKAGGTKALSTKKYSTVTESRKAHKDLLDANDPETRKAILTKQLKENKIQAVQDEIERIEELKYTKLETLNKNLDKVGKKIKNQFESAEKNAQKIKEIQDKITDKIIEKASKIKDASVTQTLLNTHAKLKSTDRQMKNILRQLSKKELPEKEVKRLMEKYNRLSKTSEKLGKELDIILAKIQGHVDDETLKLMIDVQNKVEKTAETAATRERHLMRGEKFKQQYELTKQAGHDVVDFLDRRIENLEFKITSLENTDDTPLLKEIEELSEKYSLLKQKVAERELSYNFYEGLDQMIVNFEQRAKTAKIYNEALMAGVFVNPNYIRKVEDGIKTPLGMTKVKGNDINKFLDSFKNLLPEDSETIKKLIKEYQGQEFYMDKNLARYLTLNSQTADQIGPFVKILNGLNNTFKKYSTLSLGFHLRNVAGNLTNLMLSGVPVAKAPKLIAEATEILNNADTIIKKIGQGIELTAKEKDQWKILQEFYDGGFAKAGTQLRDLEEVAINAKLGSKYNIPAKLSNVSNNINEAVDSLARLSLLKYAMENPDYVRKLGVKSPVEAVRFALLDPSNLTEFEKDVIKKVIPFYTFTKQNLLFQSSNLIKNTPKYNRLLKTFDKVYDSLDEDGYRDYQKNNFQVPVGVDEKGNAIFLKTNLPVGDLGEFLNNPLNKTLNSVTPLIKTPFENAIGRDLFTGQEIDRSAIETVAKMIGINTITTDMWDRLSKVVTDTKMNNTEKATKVFNSLLQYSDNEKIRNSKVYEEYLKYKDYVAELKNQGIHVPTINELNQKTRLNTQRLKRKRTSS